MPGATDTVPTDGQCYVYTLTGTDNVGNTASTTTSAVLVDTTAPAGAVSLSFGGFTAASTTGTTVYYRPTAAAGAVTVTASGASDPQSGLASYVFPAAPTGWLQALIGTTQAQYSHSGSPTASPTNNVHAINTVGIPGPDAPFALTPDPLAPTTTIQCNGGSCAGWFTAPVTVSLSPVDGGSGVASTRYTRDGTDPTTSGTAQTYAGSYTVSATETNRFYSTDNVGNQEPNGSQTIQYDAATPTSSIALSGVSGGAFKSGTTVYYQGSAAGSFTLTNTVTDANSGPASSQTAALGGTTTGWTHTPSTVSTPAGGPYVSDSFSWSAGTSSAPTENVTGRDVAGNSTVTGLTYTNDSTAPTGGSIAPAAFSSSVTFGLNRVDFTDGGSGIASNAVTRSNAQAPSSPGVCPASGYTGSTSVPGATDTVPTDGQCYRYTLTGTDNVGNTATATATVLVDTTAPPAAPTFAIGESAADLFTDGSTVLYYKPGGTSTFNVTASASDAQSGIAIYAWPAVTGWTGAGGTAAAHSYTLNGASGNASPSVTATNNTGLTSPAGGFAITADSTAPAGGSISVPAFSSSTTVSITKTNYSDAGSGIASNAVTRSNPQAPSSPGVCPASGYTGSTGVPGATDTVPTDGRCYVYTLTGTDNVGNIATAVSSPALVDTTAPTGGVNLAFGSFTAASAAGTTVYYRPSAGAGSVTVTASNATDAESGVASYVFPAAPTGWSRTLIGTTQAMYSHTGSPTASPTNNVHAVNNASGTGPDTSFALTADGAAPTTTIQCNGGSCAGWFTTAVTVSLSPSDGGSGVASTRYTTDGSDPTTSGTAQTYTVPFTVSSTSTVRLSSTDNVGNQETPGSQLVQIDGVAPTSAIALSGVSGGAFKSGTTVYYRSAAAGSFTLTNTVTDANSGPASSQTAALGGTTTGWTHTPSTVSTPAGGPYVSNAFSWSAGTSSAPTENMTGRDVAGNATVTGLTFTDDSTGPTGGTISVPAFSSSTTVTITKTNYTDGGSGLAGGSNVVTRTEAAPSSPGVCPAGGYANGTTVGGTSDTVPTDGLCYRYTLDATDNVGNTASTSSTVLVDTTAPAAFTPTLANGGDTDSFVGGTTVYLRTNAGANGGTFTVSSAPGDPESGIQKVNFPDLSGSSISGGGDDLSSPYSNTYTWTTSSTAAGSSTVTATNNAALTRTGSFTVALDNTAPSGGSISVPATSTSTTIAITKTNYGDAGSGIASNVVTRMQAAPTGTTCPASGYGSPTTVAGTSDAVPTDGLCYRYTLDASDNVGNTASASSTILVDTTPPAVSVTAPTPVTGAGGQFWNAGAKTLFVNPGVSGSFTLNASASDADSGIAQVAFPDLSGVSGWTAGSTGGADGSSPFSSPANYAWTASLSGSTSRNVVATNGVGTTASDSVTITADAAAPTGGSISVPAFSGSTTVTITKSAFSDAGSGIAGNVVTRMQAAPSSAGVCPAGGYANATTVAGASDTVPSDGLCYRYTLTGTDNVGNTAATSATVLVDTTAPTISSVAFSGLSAGNTYDDGAGTLYFRPSAGGAFTVTANAADGESDLAPGNAAATFSSLNASGGSNFSVTQTGTHVDVGFAGSTTSPSTPRTVHVTNNAGIDSTNASYSVTADSTAPAGQTITLSSARAPYVSGAVAWTLGNGTDGGSGLDLTSRTVTRESAPLAGDSCGTFTSDAGTFTSPDSSVANGFCYRYTFTVADHVGNVSAPVTVTAKVDTAAPSLTVDTPATLSGDAFWNDTTKTLYYRPAGSGSFTLAATAFDAETAVTGVSFPDLSGDGFGTAGGTDATSPHTSTLYTWSSGGATEPGAQTVTATDKAANTRNRTVTIAADSTAPSTTTSCNGGGSCAGWVTSTPVTYQITGSDAGSGVKQIRYTTNGSDPLGAGATVVSGSVATAGLNDGDTIKWAAVDNVGNVQAVQSDVIQIDSVPPTNSFSIGSATGASFDQAAGRLYFSSAAAGSFTISDTLSDASSGPGQVAYPAIGTSGWTHGAETVTTGPDFTSSTYAWSAGAGTPGAQSIVGSDVAGNTRTGSISFVDDTAAPTGGALTVNGRAASGAGTTSYSQSGSFPIDVRTDFVEAQSPAQSGLASSTLTRRFASFSAPDTCGSFGSATTLSGAPAQSGLSTGCYRYTLTGTDAVGNTLTLSTTVEIDTSDPTAPALTLSNASGGAWYSGTGSTLFFRPGAPSGGFDVDASSTDADSGIQGYTFPSAAAMGADWSVGGTGSSRHYSYTPTAAEPGAQSVVATNNAGRTASSSFAVTADSTAPAGQTIALSGAGAPYFSGPVSFTLGNGSDGGSGLDLSTRTVTRESAPLSGNSCGTFTSDAGTFTSPDSGIANGFCYRYTFTVADHVGNVSAPVSVTAKVDTVAPTVTATAPTPLTDGGAQFWNGGTKRLYVRPSTSGSFTLNATTSDAETAIVSTTFPDLSGVAGWTGDGSTATYSWSSGAGAPGAQTISAADSAGNTGSDAISIVTDSTAPAGQTISITGGAWHTGSSVAFVTGDGSDGGSGLDLSTRTVTRESAPLSGGSCGTFTADTGTFTSPDATVASGFCYRYEFTIADKVGNVSTGVSDTAMVDGSVPTVNVTAPTATAGTAAQFYAAGSKTLFVNPAAGGSFTLAATASDAQSGLADVAFPDLSALGGWSGTGGSDATSPYDSGTYSWTSGAAAPGSRNVVATNGAGATASDAISIVADASAPTGQSVSIAGGYYGSLSVALTPTDGTDTGSGIDTSTRVYERREATLAGDACTGWSGWSPVTLVGGADTSVASGHCYEYRLLESDRVGNQSAPSAASATAKVDTGSPTVTVTAPTVVSGGGNQDWDGVSKTLFFRPSGSGSFTLNAAGSDPETSIASTAFPNLSAVTGWTGDGTTATYSWSSGAAAPGSRSISVADQAGNTASDSFTIASDSTAPTGQSVSVTGGWTTATSVALTPTDGTDGGSGLDPSSRVYERHEATLTNGTCGAYGAWTTVSNPDTSVQSGSCYEYRLLESDRVGNQSAPSAASAVVMVDTSAPSAPALSFGAFTTAATDGASTVWFRPSAAAGSFTVSATSTDAQSDIASYVFPAAPSGWSRSASGNQATYDHSGSPTASATNNVHAVNGAGTAGPDTSFALTADAAGPTGVSATVTGGYVTTLSVPVTLDPGTDAESGVDPTSGVVLRDEAPLAGGSCGVFTGTFTPVTLVGGNDTTVQSGRCYVYRYQVDDKVGNRSTSASSATVKVDTSAPTAPALTFGSFTNASASGSTIFVRPGSNGGFTVGASSTDPESGVASTSWPSLGAGWTNAGGAYSFDTTAGAPGAEQVTTRNGAGLDSSPAAFSVAADGAAPTTTATCNGVGCTGSWYTTLPVTVALSANDGAGSGVFEIRYTLDGSDPTPLSPVYSTAITLNSTTTVKYRAYDEVGNEEAVGTTLVRIDSTPPSAPSVNLSESSPNEFVGGSTLYYNPSGSNSATFDAAATSNDAESGIDHLTFPALGGMTGGGADASSPYGATYGWDSTATTSPGSVDVVATNGAGLTSTTSFTVTKDVTGPSGGSVDYADGYDADGQIPVSTTDGSDGGSGVDAASGVIERRTRTLANGACTGVWSGWTTVASTPDTVASGLCAQYRYTVSDNVGNPTTYVSPNTVQVDLTDPAAPSLGLSESSPYEAVGGSTLYYNPSGSNSATFDVSATTSDADSGIDHVDFPTVFGGDSATATGPYTTTYSWSGGASASGAKTVAATNGAGRTATSTFTVTPDTTAPSGGTFTYPNGFDTTGSITVTLPTPTDGGAGVAPASAVLERQTKTLAAGSCTGSWSAWTPVAANPDTVANGTCVKYRYRISDRVGNEAVYTSPNTVLVDASGPTVSLGDPGAALHGTVSLGASASDTGSDVASVRFQVKPDGGSTWTDVSTDSAAPFAASFDSTSVVDGDYDFRAIGTDGAGNTTTSAVVGPRTVDNAAPDTTIATHPTAWTTSTSGGFTFTSDEPGTFECRLDGGAWSACATPDTLTGLAEGTHTLDVRAVDAAGNTDATPDTFTWKVDLTPPSATLNSLASRVGATVALSGSATDNMDPSPTVTFEYKQSTDATWTATGAAWNTTVLGDGSYDVRAVGHDAAGNAAPSTSQTVDVDNHAPSLTIASPAQYVSQADGSSITVAISTADTDLTKVDLYDCPTSTPTCGNKVDTANADPWTLTWDVSGYGDGDRVIRVVATDGAGNTGSDQRTITIDRTPPTGVTVDYADGYDTDGSMPVSTTNGSDPGSGLDLASATLERKTATLAGGTCGAYPGTWSAVGSTPDTVAGGECAIYRYRIADNAGNVATAISPHVVKVDTTPPSTPSLSFSALANASVTGGTVYFRPGVVGSFTVSAASSDAESTVTSTDFPTLGSGWTESAGSYSFDGTAIAPSGAQSVVVHDGAGLTSSGSFDVVADSTAPSGGSISYADGWRNTTSVPVTLPAGTDAGSGIPTGGAVLERETATVSGGTCTGWTGFAPVATDPASLYSDATIADGSCYRYRYVVTDAVGNRTTYTSSSTVEVDTTNPTVSLGAIGSPKRATIALSATASDTGSGVASVTFEQRLGAGAWTPIATDSTPGDGFTANFDSTTFADGVYDFRAVANDQASNSATDVVANRTIDNTPPVTTLGAKPDDPDSDATPTFGFGANEPSTFECRVDGGAWTLCVSPDTLPTLGDGPHTFDVRATDTAGNVEPAPPSHAWTLDTIPPIASMTSPDPYVRGTITLDSTSSDPGGSGVASSHFELSPAGANSWSTIGASFDTTTQPDGLYDFRVSATDNAANVGTSAPIPNIRIDNTPPDVSVTSPVAGAAVTGTVDLTALTDDHGADPSPAVVFEVSPAGQGTWTQVPATWDTNTGPDAVVDGSYDIRATATDWAGNVTTSAVVADVLVDNTAPTVAVTAPTDSSYVNSYATDPLPVAATADDGVGSGVVNVEFFACSTSDCVGGTVTSLGTDTAGPYTGSWPIPADGARAIKAVATDGVGHQSTAISSVIVDRTLPDTSILTKPGDPTNDPAPSFTFGSNEPGSTFQCRLDGAAWTPCTSPKAYTPPPADGTHTVEIRAIDPAGNIDDTPDSWTWLEDTTPPTGSVDDPAALNVAHSIRGTLLLTGSSDDPGGANASGVDTVTYQYCDQSRDCTDDANWAGLPVNTASLDTTAIDDAIYKLRVHVTDRAGNAFDSAPVNNVKVDNAPPTSTQDDPGSYLRSTVHLTAPASDPQDQYGNDGSLVDHVDFQLSPAGTNSWSTVGTTTGTSGPYAYDYDTTLTADGMYDFRTIATDRAGNVQPTSTPVTGRMIDNTPPLATMTDPGQYLRRAVTLASTTSDPVSGGVASGVADVTYEYANEADGVWHSTPASWDTTAVPDGTYDVRVTATDRAGNSTVSTAVTGRIVDNTRPQTSDNAPSGWQSGGVTVTLTASDPTSGGVASGVNTTEYRLDGGAWTAGTTVNVPAVDGSHTISYFSADNAGNIETPKTAVVLVDTTPPACPGCSADDYVKGTVELSVTPDDTGAPIDHVTFQISQDGSTWTDVGTDSTPTEDGTFRVAWDTTNPNQEGAWHVQAVIVDAADNSSTVDLHPSGAGVVVVDNVAPTVSVGAPGSGTPLDGTIKIAAVADDANPLTYVFYVDGVVVGSGSDPNVDWDSRTTRDGAHTITIKATDPAKNTTTSAGVSIIVDNNPPTPSMNGLGAAVHGTVTLSASSDGDTASVEFQRRPAGGSDWTTVGSTTGPFSLAFDTTSLPDGVYEFRAFAKDQSDHTGASAPVSTRIDNTLPTGTLTIPTGGPTPIGGPSQALAATANDTGSGVASVRFEFSPAGAGSWQAAGTATSSPYGVTWDATTLASGDYDFRIVVDDVAGNERVTTPVTAHVDTTPPQVTLVNPGANLSGSVPLTATTIGSTARVEFSISPAGANAWTTVATDGAGPPWSTPLNTAGYADGLYDLQARAFDSLGNNSASVVTGIRLDNATPSLLTSDPADGSTIHVPSQTRPDHITLDASELVGVSGVTLDGLPTVAPVISGGQLTFNTGSIGDGPHTLAGTIVDPSGKTTPFQVHFTVWTDGTPTTYVEKNTTADGSTTLTSVDAQADLTVPAGAWSPSSGDPSDWLVIRTEPTGTPGPVDPKVTLAGDVIDATAHWALAGTAVHSFAQPLDLAIVKKLTDPNAQNVALAATWTGGEWRLLKRVPTAGALPGGWQDGFYESGDRIHVLTRHLSVFTLVTDAIPPKTPGAFAGHLNGGELVFTWTAPTDNSGAIAGFRLVVDGVPGALIPADQTSVDFGPYDPNDAHQYQIVAEDPAGNASARSKVLIHVPVVVGLTVPGANTALAGSGLPNGTVAGAAGGTVTDQGDLVFVLPGTSIPLSTVAAPAPGGTGGGGTGGSGGAGGGSTGGGSTTVPTTPTETAFAFHVVSTKHYAWAQRHFVAAQLRSTRAGTATVRLLDRKGVRRYTWRLDVQAGSAIVRLRMPRLVRQLGSYRLVWTATAGDETLRSTTALRLARFVKGRFVLPPQKRVDVVLVGSTLADRLVLGTARPGSTTQLAAGSDQAFDLAGSPTTNVQVAVVDVDELGLQFVRDLHLVFPEIRIVVLSDDATQRLSAAHSGASVVLAKSGSGTRVAKAVRRLTATR
ncbi:MAG TPA: Ig-like domain-containing protein [Gaiellaceae bacterium]